MGTLLFVHGTGVREPDYSRSLAQVRQGLHGIGMDVQPCYWGEIGVRLHANGASIPLYDVLRGQMVDEGTTERARWDLLYQDPLFELRLLGQRGGAAGKSVVLGTTLPGWRLKDAAERLQPEGRLAERLAEAYLDGAFEAARAFVVRSPEFGDAVRSPSAREVELRVALAQALVAAMATREEPSQADDRPRAVVLMDGRLRDQIVKDLVEALGGQEYSVGGFFTGMLIGLATRLASDYARRHRGSLTDASYPLAGDVLLYQARGQVIREFIRRRIDDYKPPVVLLGHSLGGIACVDLLVEEHLEKVSLLITVGSQAPFLYEIGALTSLSYGEKLPAHFPEWLNLYDVTDLLSYIAAGVFPGRVKDVEVDNRQPFPQAHSAYWTNSEIWDAIKPRLP